MNEPTGKPSLGAIWMAFAEMVPLMPGTARYSATWDVAALEAAGRDLLDMGVWVSANDEVRSDEGAAHTTWDSQPLFVLPSLPPIACMVTSAKAFDTAAWHQDPRVITQKNRKKL